MALRHWKFVRWLESLKGPQHGAAETRVRIINVTRQTLLADSLEVADNGARRRRGLLGRNQLSPGEGLWIVPCEAVHTFGMQFSIDLVYLDRKLRVLKTRSSVRPGRLSACFSARSVVELPSGTVLHTRTERGDIVALLDDSQPATSEL